MKLQDRTNPIYVKACQREALFRDGADAYAEVEIPQRVIEYENFHRTGNKEQDEFSYLKSLGKFPRGLSLGSGGGSYELKLMAEGIVDQFLFIDISEEALNTLRENAEKLGLSNKIETSIQDLNFLELPQNTYDLVSCQNMLHHIINLEETLHAVNQSLTENGIFVTNECIGENKMYWTDLKMSFIDTIKHALAERKIETKDFIRTNPKVLTNNCPFECIRSEELYRIIHHYFGQTKIRESIYGHLQHTWNALSDDRSDVYFDTLEKFDSFVKDGTMVRPNRLYGIYRKSDEKLQPSSPRSAKEMKEQIGVHAFNERSLMQRSASLQKKFPKLYNILKRLYFTIR